MRKSFIILFFIITIGIAIAANDHFPYQLNNSSREKKVQGDNEKLLQDDELDFLNLTFNVEGEDYEAIVIHPVKYKHHKIPSILFFPTGDETIEEQIPRIRHLAKRGYLVMCSPWNNHEVAREALEQLQKYGKADKFATGILGAHGGGTEALYLACTRRKDILAVVSITSRPPYDQLDEEPAELINAPVLLIHGEADLQLPISVSSYFYYDLLDKEKHAKIIRLPFSEHYFNDSEWILIMNNAADFFDIYLKGEPDPDAVNDGEKRDD